jgi:hypothetical protein
MATVNRTVEVSVHAPVNSHRTHSNLTKEITLRS